MKFWNLRSVRTALLLTVITVLAGGISLRAEESKLLKKAELKALVSTAGTAEDHQRQAAHFNAEADQLEEQSKEHTELAAQYKSPQLSGY